MNLTSIIKIILKKRNTLTSLSLFGFLWLFLSIGVFAQSESSFEKFKRQNQENFTQYKDSVDNSYNQYVEEQKRKFNEYVNNINKYWDSEVIPTKTNYVEYNNDYQTRSNIDFQEGTVKVSTVVELPEPEADTAHAKQLETVAINEAKIKLKIQVKKTLTSAGKVDVYTGSDDVKECSGEPLLKDQVIDKSGEMISPQNIDDFIKDEVLDESNIKIETIESRDGRRRIKLTTTYKLIPEHLKKRAQKLLPLIRQYSDKNELDIRLVLAVIHTESHFNPKATSHIPAFGLMQIVPSSGGRDAYKYLFQKDSLVTADYLYDSEKNIEMGTAYLYVIRNNYLKFIEDNQIAYPCMIAAYNGGIGNVCQVFTGVKNLKTLKKSFNITSYDVVVNTLKEKMPTEEARDYVKDVLARMSYYDEWAN